MKSSASATRRARAGWPHASALALLAALSLGVALPAPCAAAGQPLAAASGAAAAQESALRVSPAARAAERRRLDVQRSVLERDYAGQRAACMKRFFVFDCLDAAARRQRDALRALRARRQHVDLLGREQRATQELESVGQRMAQHAPVDATRQRELRARREADARRAQRQRAGAASTPAAAAAAQGVPALPRRDAAPPAGGPALAPEPASQARAAREQRRQREIEYQDLRERVRAQQRNPPAPPLPVPPASGPLQLPR